MDLALRLDGVTKRFGTKIAVDRLDLAIPRGCIYGFLGQNGAGKTTTIRMIMNILTPDEGRLEVLGHPDAASVKDRLGYLPEEKGLYKRMKAHEMLAYFGRLKGMPAAAARARSRELLARYGLAESIDKRCDQLSKGMSQKVQVLSTLMHEPELVILDEPFSGLDPVNQQTMRGIIRELRTSGRTVIFSTHVMEHAELLCDSVVIIHAGRKLVDGGIAQVRASGDRAIHLDYEGDAAFIASLPGVARVDDKGQSAEIFLSPGGDAQALLAALVGKVGVRRFDLREPSLHDVFLRTVQAAEVRS
jgi:ABC-2 type transport system ATP-binding protein